MPCVEQANLVWDHVLPGAYPDGEGSRRSRQREFVVGGVSHSGVLSNVLSYYIRANTIVAYWQECGASRNAAAQSCTDSPRWFRT